MALLKPRNRVVVFRLTQDEYQDLKTASSVRGARNVSDFARSELLTSIGRDRLSQVDQRISNLESAVYKMAQLLEGMADRK